MNRTRIFQIVAAACAVMPGLPAQAQIQMDGDFVRLIFNDTGDLIASAGGGQAIRGVEFRPDTAATYRELIARDPFPAEAWTLALNGRIVRSYDAANYLVGDPTVTVNNTGNVLSTRFAMDLADPAFGAVRLTQTVTLGMEDKRARFDISVENLATGSIDGVRYLRTVNPKQGLLEGLPAEMQSIGTKNQLGASIFPDGVAVDSTNPKLSAGDALQRHLALGSTDIGARVNAFGNAFGNADVTLIDDAGYYELTAAGPVEGGGGTPFLSDPSNPVGLNLWFGGDAGSALAPGAGLNVGTFYYVFAGPEGGPAVPEPGPIAMVLGPVLAVGLMLAGRRRTQA